MLEFTREERSSWGSVKARWTDVEGMIRRYGLYGTDMARLMRETEHRILLAFPYDNLTQSVRVKTLEGLTIASRVEGRWVRRVKISSKELKDFL